MRTISEAIKKNLDNVLAATNKEMAWEAVCFAKGYLVALYENGLLTDDEERKARAQLKATLEQSSCLLSMKQTLESNAGSGGFGSVLPGTSYEKLANDVIERAQTGKAR